MNIHLWLGILLLFLLVFVVWPILSYRKKRRALRLIGPFLSLREMAAEEESEMWIAGRDLRKMLETAGISLNYATFYLLMSQLTEKGTVESRDREDEDGRVRYYRLPRSQPHHQKVS